MPLVEYSQARPCNLTSLPFTSPNELQQYFTINDVNLKIKKYSRSSYGINTILNTINRNQSKNWFGFTLFNDYQFDPTTPGPGWRYYVLRFQRGKEITQLAKVHSITLVMNSLRTILPLVTRSMAIYTEDNNLDLIIRTLIDAQLSSNSLTQCHDNQIMHKGFSKIIHYKVIEKETQLTVTIGYTQSYLQLVYLLLLFRETNYRRFKIDSEITLQTLDMVVEHLIQIMRKMAKTNDFNLYGKGVKAVFETYLLQDKFLNIDKIKQRLQEHKRLLLLYECQYARISVYNATVMGKIEDLILKKDLFYQYLSTVLFMSKGLALDDDLSYCCFMENNKQSQEVVTFIAVQKKTDERAGTIPIQMLIETGIKQLIRFFQVYPQFYQTLAKTAQFQKKISSPTKMLSIKPNFKYLQMNKNIMISKIKREQDQLVPYFPRITSAHFFKQYQRLQSVFTQQRKNAEYVQNLIVQIMKTHRKKMQKYLPQKSLKSSPQKQSSFSKSFSTTVPNNLFQLSFAKCIKQITQNTYCILQLIDRPSNSQSQIISVLVQNNPYITEKILCHLTQLICNKYLQIDYNKFLNKNSIQPLRNTTIYRYLIAVCRCYNQKHNIDVQALSIDEQLLELIQPKSTKSQADAYYSLLSKITNIIFKPTKDNRVIKMIFKIIQQFLLKVSNVQSLVYTLLGGVYVEVLMGGVDQPIKTDKAIIMNNNPYKNSSVSDLSNNIKKDKILQFIGNKGVQGEMNTIQNFFESFKKMHPSNQQTYEIYKDFIYSNYDLLTFIQEIYQPPTTKDLMAIHRFFTQNQLKNNVKTRGTTAFSLFHQDIEQYNLPSNQQQIYLTKSYMFNKTLSTSRFVKDLYKRNPEAKLAGVTMKQIFKQPQQVQIDLYDRNVVVHKTYGIGLTEAQQYFNMFVNLDYKYRNYQRLSEEQRTFFNQAVQRILTKQSKLRVYVQKTLDLEIYLKKLEKQ